MVFGIQALIIVPIDFDGERLERLKLDVRADLVEGILSSAGIRIDFKLVVHLDIKVHIECVHSGKRFTVKVQLTCVCHYVAGSIFVVIGRYRDEVPADKVHSCVECYGSKRHVVEMQCSRSAYLAPLHRINSANPAKSKTCCKCGIL